MSEITYVEAVIKSFNLPSNYTICDYNGRPVFGRVANVPDTDHIFKMTELAHNAYYNERNIERIFDTIHCLPLPNQTALL